MTDPRQYPFIDGLFRTGLVTLSPRSAQEQGNELRIVGDDVRSPFSRLPDFTNAEG
jgi:hypothetical protein